MNGKLNGLFYGSLENITISNDYQVLDAPLVKNTNYFSCILQNGNNLLNQEDFTFTLEAANGVMDHTNSVGDGAGLLSSIPAGSQYTR